VNPGSVISLEQVC